MKIPLSLTVFFIFVGSGPLLGDTLRLSSGQVVHGQVLRQNDETVIMATGAGVIALSRKEVLEIEVGSGGRIIAIPRRAPSTFENVWQSFIPFYSPLYRAGEPSLGVPFGLLNGFVLLRLLSLQSRKVSFTNWQEPGLQGQLAVTAAIAFEARRASNPSASIFGQPESLYLLGNYMGLLRLFPVHGYRIGDRFYTKDAWGDEQRLALHRYLGIGVLGALGSVMHFRFFEGARSSGPTTAASARLFVAAADHQQLRVGVQIDWQ